MLRRILIAAVGLWWSIGHAESPGEMVDKRWAAIVPDAQQVEKLRALVKQNRHAQAMREKAQAMVDYTQSEDYQRKMDEMIGKVFPEQAKARAKRRATDQRLYLFVSSSIPDAVLRRYAAQLEGLPGAMMVLRGFVGGATHIKPTMRWASRWVVKDPGCAELTCPRYQVPFIVDPNLFRRYHIERVPAVVTVAGLQTDGSCSEGNTETVHIAGHHVALGDAPLGTLLAGLAEQGDSVAADYVRQIEHRREGYGQ